MPYTVADKVKSRVMFFPHNVIGHPLAGILELFGLTTVAEWVHDVTIPTRYIAAERKANAEFGNDL